MKVKTLGNEAPSFARNAAKPPRVVLSFGVGRLHFVQAAESLIKNGIDLTIHQGWVPNLGISPKLIDFIGKALGSPHLSVGMKKRAMPFLAAEKNIGLPWAEIFTHVLLQVSSRSRMSRGIAARTGWRAFGRASAARLGSQQIFHVRSGAGFQCIKRARQKGMFVIVDHSIAHPAFLEKALKEECNALGLPFWLSPSDPFWQQVLDDCLDADLLMVNSDFVKRTFVEQGLAPEKIKVVYLGVRNDFASLKKDYEMGQQMELLFTGQFGARKGARCLLEALEKLQEEGCKFHLTVLGNASEARTLLERSSVAENVTLAGFVPQDELKEFIVKSDIFVFPSLAEGCASSAMEALAAGLPVIATEETGLPARHREEAWIVPAKDSDALAFAIRSLAEDGELRKKLGVAAAAMMSDGFTWQDYGRNVANIYSHVIIRATSTKRLGA